MKKATRPYAEIDPTDVAEPFVSQEQRSRSMSAARTRFGIPLDLARSALQKSLRRGDEVEAAYWAWQFVLYGWSAYVWRVLKLVASEDVGVGDMGCAVRIAALAANEKDITNGFRKEHFLGICLMQGIIDICRSPKSWQQVHLLLRTQKECLQTERGEIPPRQPPPYAHDAHTETGRRRGAQKADWYGEHACLSPLHPDADLDVDPHGAVHGDPEVA